MSGIQFSALVTDKIVSFTGTDGKNYVVGEANNNYTTVRELLKKYQGQIANGPIGLEAAAETWKQMTDAADVKQSLIKMEESRVTVRGGKVFYDNEEVNNSITERILWSMREGFDAKGYILFLEDLMENPSHKVVEQVFRFMEHNKMGITSDGCVIAYKSVRENYKDQWSGTIDNSVGQIVRMRRNKVTDDPQILCGPGLHFCNMDYLGVYGTGKGRRIMITKIKPRHIVSIPVDHNNAKARCCEYEVIAEYTGDDRDDILARQPIWTNEDFGYQKRGDNQVYIKASAGMITQWLAYDKHRDPEFNEPVYKTVEKLAEAMIVSEAEATDIINNLEGADYDSYIALSSVFQFEIVPVDDVEDSDDDDGETLEIEHDDDEQGSEDDFVPAPAPADVIVPVLPVNGNGAMYVVERVSLRDRDASDYYAYTGVDVPFFVPSREQATRMNFDAALKITTSLQTMGQLCVYNVIEVPKDENA